MKKLPCLLGLFMCLLLSCAEANIQLRTIPTPETEKIRIFIYPITGSSNMDWAAGPQTFLINRFKIPGKLLKEGEIYEVVKEEDIKTVLGGQDPSFREWKRNNWKLVREVGKNVNADYGLIIQKSRISNLYLFSLVLVNIKSGKKFDVLMTEMASSGNNAKIDDAIVSAYDKIFSISSSDMLATAIRKIRPSSTELSSEARVDKVLEKPKISTNTQLAVFDIESTGSYRIVSLILSESLREQFLQRKFVLVNRENIKQVLNEIGLQQTGIIDEKQAIQVGKGLAVQQIVVGRLGLVGKTLVLQVKRIDVESMRTLAVSSLECEMGKEEDLLGKMPNVAGDLVAQH